MSASSRGMMGGLLIAALIAVILIPSAPASAQVCGANYILKPGDTLADIARAVYGSAGQWSIIYYANQDRLGDNVTLLVPGISLKIPCIGQQNKPAPAAASPVSPPAPAATPPVPPAAPAPAPSQQAGEPAPFQLSSMVNRIAFLTAEGYPPFTGRNLPEGGLLIDLLQSSLNLIKTQARGAFDYQVSWVNDWAAHLNPLLITHALDAGIPWAKPDCNDTAALDRASQYICQKFFFSDPFYESVTVMFVRNDSTFTFDRDDQAVGKTLCRTRGWSTYDLDKGGRHWVKENKITLMQPQTSDECFRLLDAKTVDAVVIPELTGLSIAATLGMADRVHALSRPVNIETMHVIIAKTHPHARTILYYVNGSLARLKETGAYDKITAKHHEQFWDSNPAAGPSLAPASVKPDASSQQKPPPPKKTGDSKKTAQP